MREVTILCGDVAAAGGGRRGEVIVLDAGAPRGSERRVNLRLDRITTAMVAALPARVTDLLEIACYAYCADQFVRREGSTMPRMGAEWRRRFRFRVAVREPDFWNGAEANALLAELLGFLSEDSWEFAFSRTRCGGGAQGFLDLRGEGPDAAFRPERVLLFSGGLDSLAGAVEALLRDHVPVVLVSHQSSPLVASRQNALGEALQERTAGGARLLHVRVEVNKGPRAAVETTQRSRSFLFASLGFAVARMLGLRRVALCENGVVSLNLPLAGHVLGARATRTTHPRTLRGFDRLFSAVAGENVRVENPLFWCTKAEVVERIARTGCGSLIAQTFSCAGVRKAAQLGGLHCGVCSQCLDRRFGVLAAGCGDHDPVEGYAVELFRGPRADGAEVTMAEAYVLSALRHARSSDVAFLGAHGEVFRAIPHLGLPAAEAAARLHDLHRRHGTQVEAVVRAELSRLDLVTDLLHIPDTSLLAMLRAPSTPEIVVRDPVEAEQPIAARPAPQGVGSVPRPVRFAIDTSRRRAVFAGGAQLEGKACDVLAALLPAFQTGQRSGVGIKEFEFMRPRTLAAILGMSEEALRRQVSRLRHALKRQFHALLRAELFDDDVIETAPWTGYRLNPRLLLDASLVAPPTTVRPSEAAAGPKRRGVTPRQSDVTTLQNGRSDSTS